MDIAIHPRAVARTGSLQAVVPLVVDLDDTLLRTDTLLESLLALARSRPSALLQLPAWLLHGRAHL